MLTDASGLARRRGTRVEMALGFRQKLTLMRDISQLSGVIPAP